MNCNIIVIKKLNLLACHVGACTAACHCCHDNEYIIVSGIVGLVTYIAKPLTKLKLASNRSGLPVYLCQVLELGVFVEPVAENNDNVVVIFWRCRVPFVVSLCSYPRMQWQRYRHHRKLQRQWNHRNRIRYGPTWTSVSHRSNSVGSGGRTGERTSRRIQFQVGGLWVFCFATLSGFDSTEFVWPEVRKVKVPLIFEWL